MSAIYLITNTLYEKQYVGQTENYKERWKTHKSISSNCLLRDDMQELGREFFDFEIIEECKKEDVDDLECYYIDYYNTLVPNGYNISPGGRKVSEETKEKLRQINLGKKHTKETVEKIRQGNLGKKQPAHAIEKTRLANLGRKRTDEARGNMSKAQMGNRHSEETKQKMSKTRTQNRVLQILPDKTTVEFDSVKDASGKLNIAYSLINRVCLGKRPNTHGFIFKYI